MAEPFTIYKLTILTMLDKAELPLSNMQIVNFFLEHDYTDFFQVQQGISDLQDAELIRPQSTRRNTLYTITKAGRETLALLKDKVTDGIESDVKDYFKENMFKIRKDNSFLANYYRTTNQDYAVRCQLRERNASLIDLTLTVKKKEQAEIICDNWKKQNEEVYAYLMDLLMH